MIKSKDDLIINFKENLKVNKKRFKIGERFKLHKNGKLRTKLVIFLAVALLGLASLTTYKVVKDNKQIIKIVDTQDLDESGIDIKDHAPLTIMSSKDTENSSKVGTIPDGTILHMSQKDFKQPKDNENDAWSYVTYDGVSGYVNSKYLKNTKPMYIDTSSYLDDYAPVRLKSKPQHEADNITLVPHGLPVYVSEDVEPINIETTLGNLTWIEVTLPSGEIGYVISTNLTSEMPAPAPAHYYGNISSKVNVFRKHN